MKNKLLLICLVLLCFKNILFAEEDKTYKTINPIVDISKTKKRKIDQSNLYSIETQAKNYVIYLLDNNLLNIDKKQFYSVDLIDKNKKWLVLLFLSEKEEEGVVIDIFDYPIKYSFYLDKKSGQISDLYLILQQ